MPIYSDSSRRSSFHLKPMVHNYTHSRDSSINTRTSYDSRSSTEGHHSTSSRSSMGGNSAVRVVDPPSHKKYRVPDSDSKYVTKTSYSKFDVTQHDKARYEPDEPRGSNYRNTEKHSSSSKRPPKY